MKMFQIRFDPNRTKNEKFIFMEGRGEGGRGGGKEGDLYS